MKIKNQSGIGIMSIVTILAMGIFTTVIPTPVLADISKQQNEKTINQEQSFTDTIKELIFSIRNGNDGKHTLWGEILTLVTNAYNNLGRRIGFFTVENKQKEDNETIEYNQKSTVDTFTESLYGEATIAPTKNTDYNAVGKTIQSTTIDIENSLTPTPTRIQPQRSKPTPSPTPTPTPTTQRMQNATPSPTSNSQRR